MSGRGPGRRKMRTRGTIQTSPERSRSRSPLQAVVNRRRRQRQHERAPETLQRDQPIVSNPPSAQSSSPSPTQPQSQVHAQPIGEGSWPPNFPPMPWMYPQSFMQPPTAPQQHQGWWWPVPPQPPQSSPQPPQSTQPSNVNPLPSTSGLPQISRGEKPWEGEQLDLHVPEAIREQILAGKAIDLGEIFAADPRKLPAHELFDIEDSDKKKKGRLRLLSRQAWSEAFSIYSFIVTRARPELAPGLFVHMSHVLDLQAGRHDWHTFDITVRRLIERGDRKWGDKCSEELLSARARQEQRFNQQGGPSAGQQTPQAQNKYEVPYGFCVEFHKHNGCNEGADCKNGWLHKCYKCKGPTPHRALSCTKGRKFGQGQQPFRRGGKPSQRRQ